MHKILLSFLVISCFLMSCQKNENRVYYNDHSFNEQWHKDSVVKINFSSKDTINPHNLFIHIRNNKQYRFNNLFLITEMNFPNGKVITDTLEYEMAHPDGKLMGSGGNIKENKLWYKQNVRFVEKGNYTFKIKQAMREFDEIDGLDNLDGILNVGLEIELNQEKQ